MTAREAHLVELVDDSGHALGEATVASAHQPPGRLHRAFSVLLIDPAGRVLLQRRAAAKTRFPLRWANSCCGHPAPGESLVEAANRRLTEELGTAPVALTEVGVYVYYAEDPATGRVEFEYDHVLRADVPADLRTVPDPDEVAELRWVDPTQLEADLDVDPRAYAPWLGGVVNRLLRPTSGTPGAAAIPSGIPADEASERSGGR
ncbi:isopentenyl-diphosphate delta-isomerase [Micromonospora globispora]|uniref:Isopentenyl-diphosphate Delta-isomerase n=1 Tax=Micromonospora globispora TaxID=1450148 RepID=A0A317JYJ5_9ACTN|nr:isopentenyl-diphosphate Delta-isomerase [Micromonospora globispora]PWU45821.1 isopentenyl-diphosphate delta-isomerase [Micromonospora globispora]PWU55966.1 isopentenyl-diphosphate delta-isomerase [Micromonospora globispora]RQW99439.1 isopentenyl-diphosphate delta-isomerase [Micromonospora globispora]